MTSSLKTNADMKKQSSISLTAAIRLCLLLCCVAGAVCAQTPDTSASASSRRRPVRVACVGASITAGATTANPATDSYPAQLGRLLGEGYEVRNFGVGGCTMLRHGNFPYWIRPEYQAALESAPDLVFIDLGGNDSKAMNRPYMHEFEQDACDMVASFASLPSKPRIILLTPIVSFVKDSVGIWDPVIVNDVTPATIRAAQRSGVEYIDMHPVLDKHPERMRDGIHPDAEGSGMMARAMYDYLKNTRCKMKE